ncbi:hypothetical protein OM427_24970 [Halomonas sp. 18H]|nr:hypothetical protein [Halomonas sp. 18H]MCW4152771.1 hypothetical protein [Halomonas sp. 18H]
MADNTTPRITLHAHTKRVRTYFSHAQIFLSGIALRHDNPINPRQATADRIAFATDKVRRDLK